MIFFREQQVPEGAMDSGGEGLLRRGGKKYLPADFAQLVVSPDGSVYACLNQGSA
jgi:hypothetical protein